jgi:hypothetical protein
MSRNRRNELNLLFANGAFKLLFKPRFYAGRVKLMEALEHYDLLIILEAFHADRTVIFLWNSVSRPRSGGNGGVRRLLVRPMR